MDKVEKRFGTFQLLSIFVALFGLIMSGILLFFEEHISMLLYGKVMASVMIVYGLSSLVKYFYDGIANDVYKFEIVEGIALLIIGLFMFFAEMNVFDTIGIFCGIFYLIIGSMKGFYTYKFMKNNEDIFPLTLIMTILFLVMGVLSIFNPFNSFMIITRLVTVFLLVGSILELLMASLFRKRAKYILKIFE